MDEVRILHSSRLDLILTNLPISNLKYSSKPTFFDHTWVQATFGQKKEHTNPTMKDYILGSEEFLIRYYDLLETELESCLPKTPTSVSPPPHLEPNSPQKEGGHSPPSSPTSASPRQPLLHPHIQADPYLDEAEEDADMSRNPIDAGLTAHNPATGRTDLHFINSTVLSRKLALSTTKLTRPLDLREKNSLSPHPNVNTTYIKK